MANEHYRDYGDPKARIGVARAWGTYLNVKVEFGYIDPMSHVYVPQGALNNSQLVDINNYHFEAVDPTTAFAIGTVSVTPEVGVTYPTYVNLEVTDCTSGKDYVLIVTPNVIQNSGGYFIVAAYGSITFTGFSNRPDVLASIGVSSTSVRVTYTKRMAHNVDFLNPAKYVFTAGGGVTPVTTVDVELENEYTVLLTTTEQDPAQVYALTVG